jgi:hypothetical protein
MGMNPSKTKNASEIRSEWAVVNYVGALLTAGEKLLRYEGSKKNDGLYSKRQP